MVWAYISWNTKSELIIVDGTLNAQRYLDQVINPIVIPEAQHEHVRHRERWLVRVLTTWYGLPKVRTVIR